MPWFSPAEGYSCRGQFLLLPQNNFEASLESPSQPVAFFPFLIFKVLEYTFFVIFSEAPLFLMLGFSF